MIGLLVVVFWAGGMVGAMVGLGVGVVLSARRREQERRSHRECGLACPCAAVERTEALTGNSAWPVTVRIRPPLRVW